jgi:hypothetical protein
LVLTRAQAEGVTIPEAVAMETTAVETMAIEPVAETMTTIVPGPGTTIALKPSKEVWVDPHHETSTKAVIHEAMIKDVVPLRSAPMPETGSTRCGGLELLDDDLIDPAFVSLSMESWRWTENWIKVYSEYLELSCLIEY